jgi:mannonate dehydratase
VNRVEAAGLPVSVIESLPVHEDIKLGRPSRDELLDHYRASLRNLGAEGIRIVCYNFMPLFDWLRTRVDAPLPDGSTSLAYDQREVDAMDPGGLALPGWDPSYAPEAAGDLLAAFRELSAEDLWAHLAYFLAAVAPAAEEAGIRLAIHPDDPPWPVFGVPRIVSSEAALARLLDIYPRPANGLCLCVGSLGASPANDIPRIVRRFVAAGRVHFLHLRNIAHTGPQAFQETGHLHGALDLADLVAALAAAGYDGPVRPDHGRAIWGERGRPGYGLYDRALGAMYLQGAWDGAVRARS